MAVGRKKAIVRGEDGSLTWGYLPGSGFVREGEIEILDPTGKVLLLPFRDVRTVAFVRDFNLDDTADPERLGRRSFPGRPRMEGLWLKLEFRDREVLEGLAPLDLGFLDGLIEDEGICVVPPDQRSNTLKLFVPRHALSSFQVLGYVASPSRPKAPRPATPSGQGGLFDL